MGFDEKGNFTKERSIKETIVRSHFDAVVCMKKREDQIRRTTRDLRIRVARFIEVDGGVLEHLF